MFWQLLDKSNQIMTQRDRETLTWRYRALIIPLRDYRILTFALKLTGLPDMLSSSNIMMNSRLWIFSTEPRAEVGLHLVARVVEIAQRCKHVSAVSLWLNVS